MRRGADLRRARRDTRRDFARRAVIASAGFANQAARSAGCAYGRRIDQAPRRTLAAPVLTTKRIPMKPPVLALMMLAATMTTPAFARSETCRATTEKQVASLFDR